MVVVVSGTVRLAYGTDVVGYGTAVTSSTVRTCAGRWWRTVMSAGVRCGTDELEGERRGTVGHGGHCVDVTGTVCAVVCTVGSAVDVSGTVGTVELLWTLWARWEVRSLVVDEE